MAKIRPVRDSKAAPALGPLGSRVMEIVWDKQRATVSDVVDELASQGTELAYTTVMTILTRLTQKRLLTREREGKAFTYAARVSRARFQNDTARSLAHQLVHGYEHLAIASFVEEVKRVGPERLQELRDLVERASDSHERAD